MPLSSIRNGYSLVPWTEPRYLTIRSRRVRSVLGDPVVQQDHAVGDVLLQAVAGQRAVAPLAGDDRRDALVLEPAEQPAQLGPQDGRRWTSPPKSDLDGVQHDPLGPDRVDGVAEADEEALQVVLAGLLDLAPLDAHVVDASSFFCSTRSSRSKPSERTFLVSSSAVSSKAMKTPGSSYSMAPVTRNSMPSSVLPQPALPQTSVGRLAGGRRR